MPPQGSTLPAKPDPFPHKTEVLLGFAVIIYFAWAKGHARAWPYSEATTPAIIFFALCSGLYLAPYAIEYMPVLATSCTGDVSKFPHKLKTLLAFLILIVLAWQQSHSEGLAGADARI